MVKWFGFGSADRTCWFGRTTEPTEPPSSAEPDAEPESSVVHYRWINLVYFRSRSCPLSLCARCNLLFFGRSKSSSLCSFFSSHYYKTTLKRLTHKEESLIPPKPQLLLLPIKTKGTRGHFKAISN